MRKALVTGCAGFIGYHLCLRLMMDGWHVVGLDNLNDYYDPELKRRRIGVLNIPTPEGKGLFEFHESDIHSIAFPAGGQSIAGGPPVPDVVIHLAAQAGVRYSIDRPREYMPNVTGFLEVLEACRRVNAKLLYASSSSVYGDGEKPLSLYAVTKKANELMAESYSHLYGLECTGLRFFTVYGPMGRPDMALWKFVDRIRKGEPIELYNQGNHSRSFTYVDDAVESVVRLIDGPTGIYDIGNETTYSLSALVGEIEAHLGEAEKVYLPMQLGDVMETQANCDPLFEAVGYKPDTPLSEGVRRCLA